MRDFQNKKRKICVLLDNKRLFIPQATSFDLGEMKVAEKIVFLSNDSDGFAATFADALNPNPSSPLRKLEEQIELPLETYGVVDGGTGGRIVHFVGEDGAYQVSIILLRSYEPPVLVCAVNELLDLITREASTPPTIVAPFLVPVSKLKFNNRSLEASSRKASLHYFQVGPETETTRLFTSINEKPPPLMQIHHEPLSCLLHLARVKGLPTSFLIWQRSSSVSHKALDEELKVIYELGELVASWTGLSFSRDRIKWNVSKRSKEEESPWKALYG